MKIEFFHTMNYWGPDHGDSWPAPPRICETEFVSATIEHGLIECGAALDAGFDSLNFAEHHYSPKQLTPNPIIFAAVAGRRFPGAQIGVFGTDLPLNNPVRIAEEYSMLDNLLDGRLRIGMLRGTPNEYLTYGSNPWESRERYEEGILLLKACFTEPEPFGWEGRYYRFRNIAVWPRRVQDPHPRILISGNSKDGAIFAGHHGLDLGFSYMGAEKCAEHASLYRKAAAEAGWEPTADNLQYRHFMYVTNSDDEAIETMKALSGGGLMSIFNGASPDLMMTMAQIGAALGGVPKHVKIDPSMAPQMVMGPALYGSPETVLGHIKDIHDVLGMGRLEVSLGTVNPLPHDAMLSSLKLIGEEVIPVLHEMGPVVAGEKPAIAGERPALAQGRRVTS